MEPTLELDDIQGHILPGFAALHNQFIGVSITDPTSFINHLEAMVNDISTSAEIKQKRDERKLNFIRFNTRLTDNEILIAHAISGSGFRKMDVDISGFVDEKIREGMYKNAPGLNDKPNSRSDSVNWKFGTPNNPLDYLFILASDSKDELKSKKEEIINLLKDCVDITYDELCSRLPKDIEHFGFRDGISQPAVRGKISGNEYFATRNIDKNDPRANLFAKPGQPLVWPGQFLFGYPIQTKDPTVAGPQRMALPKWSRNGSFLVLRRLGQDVALFNDTMQEMADSIQANYGVSITVEELKAKFVGRWKDGTPLTVSPEGPDSNISGNTNRLNNFTFSQEDEITIDSGTTSETLPPLPQDLQGNKCPHFAHIRKINPRKDGTDIGTEETSKKLILRRGIPFGSLYDNEKVETERGLLFLSYQASIKNQFEFLQRNWSNAFSRPSTKGNDFIIGQPEDTVKRALFLIDNKEVRVKSSEEWVFTTGGEYLFTPGLNGLKLIIKESKYNLKK